MSTRLCILMVLCVPLCAFASPSADEEAKYTEAINKRADAIVVLLKIDDQEKSNRVHEILVGQYRALRDWHDANDPRLKGLSKDDAAPIRATLKPIHDTFLARLAAELTPAQIDIVRDKMTYGKVKVTYDAYVEIVNDLTSEQKEKIKTWLIEAREEAMDGGSAEEKDAIFNRYKGKINNYLASEGVDMKQKTREWQERQKSKRATTRPTN